jgi:hypothetical protein
MNTQSELLVSAQNNASTESFAVESSQLKFLEDAELVLVGGGQLLTPY